MNKQILLIHLLLVCSAISAQTMNEENSIRQQGANFSKFYLERDFQSMSNAYTDSAILMAPSKDVIIGKKAILAFWQGTTSKLLAHKCVPDAIIVNGNEAHEFGYIFTEYQTNDGGKNSASSKYYIIWERTKKDGWKMKFDMWNSRNPEWNQK